MVAVVSHDHSNVAWAHKVPPSVDQTSKIVLRAAINVSLRDGLSLGYYIPYNFRYVLSSSYSRGLRRQFYVNKASFLRGAWTGFIGTPGKLSSIAGEERDRLQEKNSSTRQVSCSVV